MAAKKAPVRKQATFNKPAPKKAPAKRVTTSRASSKPSGSFFDYFRFGESYTSLILGMVVVIIATILLVAFFRNRGIQEVNPRQDISATNISPAQQKTYTVREGDTLWSIAESQLNDGYRWQEIMKANNLQNGGMIEEGTKLVIPSTRAQAVVSPTGTAQETPAPTQTVSPTRTATPTTEPTMTATPTMAKSTVSPTKSTISPTNSPYMPGGEQGTKGAPTQPQPTAGKITGASYTVQTGDYLWEIAERAYGDGYKWVEIARANNIQTPDIIHTGNVLKLPR
jgi:nucleoid-associated protein YgaU